MRTLIRPLRDFFADLKRRKVYRAAVVYVLLAAGIIELSDILAPVLGLPDRTLEFVFAAAVIGLPVVLILAWLFDLTPGGLERTAEPEQGVEAPASLVEPGHGAQGDAPRVIAPEEPDPRSLAVLPFENLSGTDEVASLASGLHGDLLTALSKVPGLTVISRRSVMAYRDTPKGPRAIARELNVGTLLEGAVQSAAGRVRLNVQLIDARQEANRWAEHYDRQLSPENIFQIQSDLSTRIVESLHAELGISAPVAPVAPAARPPTADLEAYRLYSQGKTWLDQRTEEGLGRATGFFQEAIARDPGYALPWAGLAEALALLQWYDFPVPDGAPDSHSTALRAVELNPRLAEAHTSLAILHSFRHDAGAALDALRRAVELGPGFAEAHLWISWTFLVAGEPEPALAAAGRALELDPLSPVVQVFAAEAFLANDDPERALQHARRARDLQPAFGLAHFMTALGLHHLDRPDEAVAALEGILERVPPGGSPRHTEIRAVLAASHAAAGRHDQARLELDRILEASDALADPFAAGLAHAALGQTDAAFEAFARVDPWRPLATEQVRYFFPKILAPLRKDSRFQDVLRRVDRGWNLPGRSMDAVEASASQ